MSACQWTVLYFRQLESISTYFQVHRVSGKCLVHHTHNPQQCAFEDKVWDDAFFWHEGSYGGFCASMDEIKGKLQAKVGRLELLMVNATFDPDRCALLGCICIVVSLPLLKLYYIHWLIDLLLGHKCIQLAIQHPREEKGAQVEMHADCWEPKTLEEHWDLWSCVRIRYGLPCPSQHFTQPPLGRSRCKTQ